MIPHPRIEGRVGHSAEGRIIGWWRVESGDVTARNVRKREGRRKCVWDGVEDGVGGG